MKRKIITTADGSKTIQIEDWNEQYHSKHGAIQEAQHVFLKEGLQYYYSLNKNCHAELVEASILEIGFGTGLNAFLTLLHADALNIKINYVGVEAYPVSIDEINQLNYVELISAENQTVFNELHKVSWEKVHEITSNFKLHKRKQFFSDIEDVNQFDLIYFDAFGARVQPELWSKTIFETMYKALKRNGVLVTYAAIGQVKRNMQALGFIVERLKGPPGKRHMLRATKK
ncbi:MAG: tRNA (5-methylaminomethyl-2-thiouridine)(34)-methyltransferase MnmD [Flavobacteriaceae bacterium]|nr:tRNA (5-methylaminomethyl-2-thiouridine)(34)-methyltransferase MnmD [Flavobacteriaceae bacterium]